MPAFDVTTNPTKLDPLKPGGKVTIVVTATNQLPRAVTARAQKVVEPATYDALVKPPPNPQRTFNQKGQTQDFPFTVEIPTDAKAGSFTTRFDVVDNEQPNDNFGQSAALKVVIVVPPPPRPPNGKKLPWWVWVIIGVAVVVVGIGLWLLLKPKHRMPNVVRKSFADAQVAMAKDRIRIVRVDTTNSDTVTFKSDIVIEQDPPGGTKLKPDSNSVLLVVQKPYAVVPVVMHQDPVTAAQRIGAAGLELGLSSSCQPLASPFNGKVVAVFPAERTLVARKSTVTISVLTVQPLCPAHPVRVIDELRILREHRRSLMGVVRPDS